LSCTNHFEPLATLETGLGDGCLRGGTYDDEDEPDEDDELEEELDDDDELLDEEELVESHTRVTLTLRSPIWSLRVCAPLLLLGNCNRNLSKADIYPSYT
jgi:hypothetical protein